jgi:hypothetical protein
LGVGVPSAAMANTFPANSVAFQQTGDGGVGGYVRIGLRNSAGTQFSSVNGVQGTWAQFYDNGSPGVRGGTFYINASLIGACGGSGCGVRTWSGNFEWNVRYN